MGFLVFWINFIIYGHYWKTSFQSRLQHNDEEKVKILEDQLKLAKNENESLKKFVTEISEQHRLISLDLKAWFSKTFVFYGFIGE